MLDAMAVLQISQQALGPAMGTGDGSIDGLAFDPARAEWHFQFAGFSDKNPGSVIVTLNETTGAVCAHEPASSRCIAQGSATAQLDEARRRRAAMEEAVRHPAPDLQGVMIALIRYQTVSERGVLSGKKFPLYVSLYWPEGGRQIDLSSEAMRSLVDTGIKLFPGSTWQAPKGAVPMLDTMSMSVGLPMRRPDGDFNVQYGFYCGSLCASKHTAVLHHDASGWHVVSSRMDSVS